MPFLLVLLVGLFTLILAQFAGLGNYLEGKLCDWINGTAMPTAPTNTYVALYTATPSGVNASGTEVSGGSYARVAVAAAGWTKSGTSPTQLVNTAAVNFPTASGNWGTIVAVALYDAATVGNELAWGLVTPNEAVNSGATFSFAAGALTFQLT